jgi:hypothetical protein
LKSDLDAFECLKSLRTLIEAIAYNRFYYIKLEGGAKKYVKDLNSLRE